MVFVQAESAARDFSDSLALPLSAASSIDVLDQLLAAERADWTLLRLVLCATTATLLMGLAGSLVA